jgi:hypothetical protein
VHNKLTEYLPQKANLLTRQANAFAEFVLSENKMQRQQQCCSKTGKTLMYNAAIQKVLN